VNIPEYIVRVIKDGREIHSERVIVGATTTPTPILSDEMEHLIFHPRWNVPDSIKVNELLPNLEVGDYRVLFRQNLRVALDGRDIDARSVDWSRTDIRKYYFYQPPGSNNALGLVKFLFPNKHDVYLHDTPNKNLFNSQVRAISHGCIRVRHPMKLAELLLAEDQGWEGSRVAMTVQKGPQDNQINVSNIPVHLTYFTAWVDDDGRARTFPDVYDHEHRIAYALAGKSHRIRREPEPTPVVHVRRTAPSTESRASKNEEAPRGRGFDTNDRPDWMNRVFQ
jgi:L,D-transpeptidase YcbB